MSTMWEQALDAEVAYRTERLREAARPRRNRTARPELTTWDGRTASALSGASTTSASTTSASTTSASTTGGDGRRRGLPGSRAWLAAR